METIKFLTVSVASSVYGHVIIGLSCDGRVFRWMQDSNYNAVGKWVELVSTS